MKEIIEAAINPELGYSYTIAKKSINRIDLFRKAFFELYEDGEKEAALKLAHELIWKDSCDSNDIVIPLDDEEIDRKIVEKIDSLLIDLELIDICNIYDSGKIYSCELDGDKVEVITVLIEEDELL